MDKSMERRPATPAELADFLSTTTQQLAQDRYLGRGPKFLKLGKRVRYRWEDINEWMEENTRESTGETPRAA